MKDQLTQYVNLLFAGAPGAEEIKQEILQNTLDRYDDLIEQGKSPEAAYRLAISGIGDIDEILGVSSPAPVAYAPLQEKSEDENSRKMRAAAIGMYIACPIPLFVLSEFGLDTLGLCLLLLLVAAATALLMMAKRSQADDEEELAERAHSETPKSKLNKSIDNLIGVLTLAIYLIVSFVTQAWFITWLIFPISGCIKGIFTAILDLKEADDYEA